MTRRLPIFLLTDYGTADSFAGELRAVIAAIDPSLAVHDVTHEVTPFAIDEGAWTLMRALPHLPGRCVVLAVVDPGVGTDRRPAVIKSGGQLFVGPDNGLFAALAGVDGVLHHKALARQVLPGFAGIPVPIANTFHGRDLFAPVAAMLAARVLRFRDTGPEIPSITTWNEIPWRDGPGGSALGRVMHVDRFGNVATLLPGNMRWSRVAAGERAIPGPVRTFAEIPAGEVRWHIDSSGCVALAANGASAAQLLGIRAGDWLTVTQ